MYMNRMVTKLGKLDPVSVPLQYRTLREPSPTCWIGVSYQFPLESQIYLRFEATRKK